MMKLILKVGKSIRVRSSSTSTRIEIEAILTYDEIDDNNFYVFQEKLERAMSGRQKLGSILYIS